MRKMEFLAVGEACKVHSDLSQAQKRELLITGLPTEQNLISASAVPHRGEALLGEQS